MRVIKLKNPIACLSCGKPLEAVDNSDVEGGIVGHIYAGYGSDHDGDILQIVLCDSCADKLEKEDRIVVVGNYLFGSAINHRGEEVKAEYD